MNSAVQLRMVGCDHRHSSLTARERLAFTPTQTADALAAWRLVYPQSEAVLLSTCNRVELYTAVEDPAEQVAAQSLAQHLADFHNVPVEDIRSDLVTLDDEAVVEHLFRVAASLDSMVVGESQILSQVKQAYELAGQIGSTGPVMHQFFQAALRVARRVAHETSLHRHRVSIPSVAIADFAPRIFERFDDKQVLVIGAGKMAHETLNYLVDAGVKRLVVLNRNQERADSLARRWQGRAAPWNALADELAVADVVVSTTGADRHVVSLAEYQQQQISYRRQQRPLFILDLAMPRDFDPAIGDELGVYLYGIDDLVEACERNRRARAKELPAAERIIDQESRQFVADIRHRATVPVIARFRAGLESVQLAELDRLFQKLPELDVRSQQEIRQFADRLVAKMLHPPLESLRDESASGSPHGLLEALQRLFRLKE